MAKGQSKPTNRGNERVIINPRTGQEEKVGGTKAGKKRMMRAVSDPLRTHDGTRRRSNPKRFDLKGKKHTLLGPDDQMKRTGTKENPFN